MKIKDFMKSLTTIHMAMVLGLMILMITMYVLKEDKSLTSEFSGDSLIFIVPILAMFAVAGAYLLPQKMIPALIKKETLREKLEGLRSILFMKYALIEGPAILSIISFYLSGNTLYLLIALVLVALLYFERPGEDKISSILKLSGSMKEQFHSSEGEIN